MAKSKNHTAHNQSYKVHKNGIKKPKGKGKHLPKDGSQVSEEPEICKEAQREEWWWICS
ncbi:hypothetical protein SLEP1_g48125 [Rubroshorea leprosula]|uniref:60S ribosomal protein L29 n=1 Tax=Rubroshorea leprosula TaxID=152421 RepID=A0AAV5LSM7_9ROSI|nr:hypothetical protein SLEP1_g48125 [Rubroshorea leprosula]